MATETKDTTKRYATRFGNHYSIIMVPTTVEVINGIAVNKPGKTIEFTNGMYETTDIKEQKFLESMPQCGHDYREVTREVGGALKAKSLEDKEKELQSREEDLKRREMALKGREEGAQAGSGKNEGNGGSANDGKDKGSEEGRTGARF